MAKLTEARKKALEIVRDNPGIAPREFAALMWPDSEGWKHSHGCGPNGSHRGGGMYKTGGSYLGKLYKYGLIKRHYSKYSSSQSQYDISNEGLELLQQTN